MYSEEDLSAKMWAGWDPDFLYVAVRVRDDRYLPNSRLPAWFWCEDCVEFFFDLDLLGDATDPAMSGDDFQILTVPGTRDHPDQPAVSNDPPGLRIGSRVLADGYALEYAFPMEALQPVQPTANLVFGMDLGIDDADAPPAGAKDGAPYRKTQMQWASHAWDLWKNPTRYGLVILGE